MEDVSAVIVNFATPDLTRAAAWSLRGHYRDLPIIILENGSPDDSRERLRGLRDELGKMVLHESNRNLHHGPGMDAGIRLAETRRVLLFDSDSILFRPGLIEEMMRAATSSDAYLTGKLIYVDTTGHNIARTASSAVPYVHPHCALLDRERYLDLPPFEQHGAPCLTNQQAAREKWPLVDFPVDDYVFHLGRGTVARHGYRLGAASALRRLRRILGV